MLVGIVNSITTTTTTETPTAFPKLNEYESLGATVTHPRSLIHPHQTQTTRKIQ